MKFALECEVESKIRLPRETEIALNGKVFKFYIDKEGFLFRIKIISDVKDSSVYSYRHIIGPNGAVIGFNPNFEPEIRDNLMNEMQMLESILAVYGNLKKILWAFPKWEYIPETEEERGRLDAYWYHQTDYHPDDESTLNESALLDIISEREKFAPLVTPLSFFREGLREYRESKYVNAFFNFFFIIEGFYARGKHKTEAVAREFQASDEFSSIVKNIIANDKQDTADFINNLRDLLGSRNQPLNVKGVVEILLKMRGDSHHFMNNPNKLEGTPFTHQKFKTVALLAQSIASQALVRKAKLFFEDGKKS
jgi:hypothetical protein